MNCKARQHLSLAFGFYADFVKLIRVRNDTCRHCTPILGVLISPLVGYP
ncbi:MAG: hypothetical protein ABI905_15180 [Betaproteobacteria bacterium]